MFGEDIGEDNSRLRENIGIVMEGLNLPDLFKAVEVDSMMRGGYTGTGTVIAFINIWKSFI